MNEKEEKVESELEEKVDTNISEMDPDDEKRTGFKESATDSDAIVIEQGKGEGIEIEKLPSFFVEEGDRRKIEIDILSSKVDGKIVSISRSGMGVNFDEFPSLRHSKEWFEFSIPAYEDMSSYRQRCAVYRREAGQMLVDRLQMRNFLVVWHLKDWSIVGRDGQKVVLTHDADGSVSDESLKKVYKIHSTIIDVIITTLEKDLLIS